MTLTFLDQDGDPSAELLVSLLGGPRFGSEPWIVAAADVEERHSGFGHLDKHSENGSCSLVLKSSTVPPSS